MNICKKKNRNLKRRHQRLRNKVIGTSERPRLYVERSLKNISVQIIDDSIGKTLVSATTTAKSFAEYGGNAVAAAKIGEEIAKKAAEKDIKVVVFDRGGRQFHGRIKALADSARENGLVF